MASIWREYIPVEGGNNEFLKCELYYSLGGMNYFTYKNEARGYYLSVTPVTKEEKHGCVMESYTMFSGVKYLLVEVTRKSKKKEQEAMAMVPEVKELLIEQVMKKESEVA